MLCVISWTKNSRAESPDLKFKYNINRDQGEKIITCFEERALCQDALKEIQEPSDNKAVMWSVIAFLTGFAVAKVIK
jgi:hypothetical protein